MSEDVNKPRSSSSQEEAFLAAFDEYADALFRHAYYRISDRERARDLVQDSFTKAWDYLVKGNTVNDFRPFLYRTINNLVIDEYRKKRSESLDAILEHEEVNEGSFEELRTGGLDDLERKLDSERLLEDLQLMPEQYRNVVVMRYIDGLQPQEIADLTGESVNVISVRIHRGIAWLRKHLGDAN
jgi:RNA polymerase sigma-70 factor (ECF subfamily)